ncbi:MAG: fructose-bisphosphate aldolase [Actinomycetota bacterium]
MGLNSGKKARLHRILFKHGLRNGTALFLPYDQGLEHGPRDFFANPDAGDPKYIVKLAVEGDFNGLAIQVGLAEKFYWDYAGEVPLILKLNGKTEIPSDDEPISSLHADVAEAVRLGADAVGYTMYVGSPIQDQDWAQYREVRADAEAYGIPLIVWAYPRGSAIKAKGGHTSFYAVDYAARVASELGADLVKVNFPAPAKKEGTPKEYASLDLDEQAAVNAVVRSAGRSLVLLSGGEKAGDEVVIDKATKSMNAGACGLIFGRNVWQRPHAESMKFIDSLKGVLSRYPA